ncbi:MAG: alpha/beta hydrolase fold [Oscillospiraceae bacterium]|jgi:pimeloyl-ACP methyl ester carboxylesterase|nr:alpha/beta hydrolase fold [Oscillospiraceae bacterium]
MTIYRSSESKEKVLRLYDEQINKLGIPCKDLFVNTAYGRTHLIETGNLNGIPLLVFHGGNATTACNLLSCRFLMEKFHIYGVDTIGHPGKSAENNLSHNNYDYGKWASEVISEIGYEKIKCLGGSFGAGILAKAMCVAPEKIEKVVLYVPAAIKNAPAYKSISMLFPIILYWITHKQKWLLKSFLPMAITQDNIDSDIFETAKCSIDNVKIKKGMPSNAHPSDMMKCSMPVLVMAGEKDCLFPAKKVIPQAKKIIPNCITYLLCNRGHMNRLTATEEQMIISFLQ